MKVKAVTILLTTGTDKIVLYVDAPSPFPQEYKNKTVSISIEAPKGHGKSYIEENRDWFDIPSTLPIKVVNTTV